MKKEMFDIYDESWTAIGTASRSDVHRLGLRHRSFHCWLIRRSGSEVLIRFQKRQDSKDTYPGLLDITAAGHLASGEQVRDAVRELEEELGISASYDDLLPLGFSVEVSEGTAGGVRFVDHERSEEFALVCELPLLHHRLQHEEVAGIYEASATDLIALFEGRLSALSVCGGEWPSPDRPPGQAGGGEDERYSQAAAGGADERYGQDAGDRALGKLPGQAAYGETDESFGQDERYGQAGASGADELLAQGDSGADAQGDSGADAQSDSGADYQGDSSPVRLSSELVPVIITVRMEHFVPRPEGYYASLFRRLQNLI